MNRQSFPESYAGWSTITIDNPISDEERETLDRLITRVKDFSRNNPINVVLPGKSKFHTDAKGFIHITLPKYRSDAPCAVEVTKKRFTKSDLIITMRGITDCMYKFANDSFADAFALYFWTNVADLSSGAVVVNVRQSPRSDKEIGAELRGMVNNLQAYVPKSNLIPKKETS